jgi:hypothetical protein
MEIIAIERQTFEQIKNRLMLFAKQIKKLCANELPKINGSTIKMCVNY